MNDYYKERREFYKSKGICAQCGAEKAVPGKTLCLCCKARRIDYNRKQYEKMSSEQKNIRKEKARMLRANRKEKGVCTRCGKRPAKIGKTKCGQCLASERLAYIKRARKNGIMPSDLLGDGHHCATCGTEIESGKLCQRCYQNSVRAIAIAREHIHSGWKYQNFVFGRNEKYAGNKLTE